MQVQVSAGIGQIEMKNYLFNLLTGYFFKNRYFFKMLILYSVLVIISVLSTSLFLTGYLDKKLEEEIYKSNKRMLTQVQIFSDTYLLEKVKSLVAEKCIDTSGDRVIWNYYNNTYDGSLEFLFKVKAKASGSFINSSFDFLDSLYFFNKTNYTVVSSREGVVSDIFSWNNINSKYINTYAILKGLLSEENQNWISPLKNIDFNKTIPIISFCQSIPVTAPPGERRGCIVVNINQKEFFKSLGNLYDRNTGQLIIVNSEGQVFAHSDGSKIFKAFDYAGFLDTFQNSESGHEIFNQDDQDFCITWVASSINDWKYISVVPVKTLQKELFNSKKYILVIITFLILASFIGIGFATSFLYKPIKALVKRLNGNATLLSKGKNELELINNAITDYSNRLMDMDKTIQEKNSLIEYKLVSDIMHSNIKTQDALSSTLALIGRSFPQQYFSIVLIEVDNMVFPELALEKQQFVLYSIMDLLGRQMPAGYSCLSIIKNSNMIAAIINYQSYHALLNNLSVFLMLSEDTFKLNCNIAVSKPSDDVLALGGMYFRTSAFLNYSFIYGYDNIFDYYTIAEYESNTADMGFEKLKHLESLLNCRRIDLFKEEIAAFDSRVKTEKLSYDCVKNFMQSIVNLFLRTVHKQLDNSFTEDMTLFREFNNLKSFEDFLSWLYSLADRFAENVGHRNLQINRDFILKIEDFICGNIDNQISLPVISKKFNITPNYLSRIYKEATGINLSNFISDKKMETAANLLVSNMKLDVSDIAGKLGYYNMPYFNKLFKSCYGMTPVQYRKNRI